MKCAFHPEAEAELSQAVDYYNACQPHLGKDFAREVYATIRNTKPLVTASDYTA